MLQIIPMKAILYLAALLGFFSSCTITQAYEFNEDFSGTTYIEIDASAMMALMGDEDGVADPFKEALDSMNTDSILEATNAQPGIQNASLQNQNGVFRFSYDFDNLKSLNTMTESENVTDYLGGSGRKSGTTDRFSQKGNKFRYVVPPIESLEDSVLASMEGMSDMMKYQLKMTFSKPVNKFSNQDYTSTADQKTITFSTTIPEFMEGNTGAVDVKF